MSNGEQTHEHPLSRDYPDPRTAEQRAEDERAVRRQVAALGRQKDDYSERELIAALLRRRADRSEVLQFDVVQGRMGAGASHTLVARGEVLAAATAFERDGARRMLEKSGFAWEPIDCLEGRVGRLVNRDVNANRLVDVARVIRRGGTAAGVNHITPLGPIMKSGEGGVEASVSRLDFPPAFLQSSATPAVLAVIDTGITDQRRSDGWLAAVTRGGNVDLLDDLPTQDGFLDLGAGHGTFAAGVVAQVAPDADLRVYKAIDSDGIGSEVDVACAMVQAVKDGAQILNLSLGVQTVDDQPPVALAAALAIINERTKGEVLVIAAAGNNGSRRPCWPAAFRQVVAVAGLTAGMAPASWSNHGFWVDCSTVGEGVLSTYPEGIESHEIDPAPETFAADAWGIWTGTSFAAPQIAGAVARIAGERGLSPRDALRELLRGGVPIPDFGLAVRILPGT